MSIATRIVWAIGSLMVAIDALQRLTGPGDFGTQHAIAILLTAGVGHLVWCLPGRAEPAPQPAVQPAE